MFVKKLFVLCAGLLLAGGPALAQKKPPVPKPRPKSRCHCVSAALLASGKSVYAQYCLTCHQADGLGVDGLNPPLVKTDYVLGDKTRLVKVLLNGLQGVDIGGEAVPQRDACPRVADRRADCGGADVCAELRLAIRRVR